MEVLIYIYTVPELYAPIDGNYMGRTFAGADFTLAVATEPANATLMQITIFIMIIM